MKLIMDLLSDSVAQLSLLTMLVAIAMFLVLIVFFVRKVLTTPKGYGEQTPRSENGPAVSPGS